MKLSRRTQSGELYARQSITVTHYGATTTKPARVVARQTGNPSVSETLSVHACGIKSGTVASYAAVVAATLARKLDWPRGAYYVAAMPSGDQYLFTLATGATKAFTTNL